MLEKNQGRKAALAPKWGFGLFFREIVGRYLSPVGSRPIWGFGMAACPTSGRPALDNEGADLELIKFRHVLAVMARNSYARKKGGYESAHGNKAVISIV